MAATTGADLVNSVMQSAGYDLVQGREYDFSEKTESIAIPNLIRSRLEENGIVVVSGGKRVTVAIPAFIRSPDAWDSFKGVEVVRVEKIAIPNLLTGPGN